VKRSIVTLCALAVALAAGIVARASDGAHFGAPFTDAKIVSLADAIAKPEAYAETAVKLRGKVLDVCQAEGCWLVMSDGERDMRIHMKGHAFAVPKDIGGKTVVVEGLVEKKTISEAQARHLAEEGSGDPEKIVGDQTIVRMMATGVFVEK
jgi:hypothetical protein